MKAEILVQRFVESSMKRWELFCSDAKISKANKEVDKIIKYEKELKEQGKLDLLYEHINHESDCVKNEVAGALLLSGIEKYREDAIKVLEYLSTKTGAATGKRSHPVYFSAMIALEEWRKGKSPMY